MKDDSLTPKQAKFLEIYLKCGNASQAYREAYNAGNMKETTIHRESFSLLRHPKIAARLKKVEKASTRRMVLTREWIIERLMKNAQLALAEEDVVITVTTNGETTTRVIRTHDASAANKALELLGKIDSIGLFLERRAFDVRQELAQLDDKELEEFINARMN